MKCIALTFDDGPAPSTTPVLAKTLERSGVKATFFMLGKNVTEYPEAVRAVAATGSEIGNHSWRHPSLTSLGTDGITRELRRTNEALEKVTGERPTLMRPPYGNSNRRVDQVAERFDLAEIFWDVDTLDWKDPDTDRIVNEVVSGAGRNQVVLMHDIYPTTINAVPDIIEGLQDKGYTLVTISELYPTLRPGGHYPVYGGRGLARPSDYPKTKS